MTPPAGNEASFARPHSVLGAAVLFRTAKGELWPAVVLQGHRDGSVDLVFHHRPTYLNGVPVCSTYRGRVPFVGEDGPGERWLGVEPIA